MKRYTVEEVMTMIKPNSYTYQGIPAGDRDNMKLRYERAKERLNKDGISPVLNLRLISVDKETAEMPAFSRKSILMNVVIHDGIDGWVNPMNKQGGSKQ